MATTKEIRNYFVIPGIRATARIDYQILSHTRRTECFKVIKDVLLQTYTGADKELFHYYSTSSKKPTGFKQVDILVRQLFCYLSRECYFTKNTGTTLKNIADYIYIGHDHTSVIYSINAIKAKLFTGEVTNSAIEDLKYSINRGITKIWHEITSSDYYRLKFKLVD